jgi:hypothetical protein
MPEQHERRAGIGIAERGDQVRPLRRRAEDLGGEPGLAGQPLEMLDRRALVAGRIDGVEADELGQQLGGVGLQRVVGDGDGRSLPAPPRIVALWMISPLPCGWPMPPTR